MELDFAEGKLLPFFSLGCFSCKGSLVNRGFKNSDL